MSQNASETIRISVSDDVASIQRVDNSVLQLPLDVLHRSSLLRNAVTDADITDEVSLSLPVGMLDAWLVGIHQPCPRPSACETAHDVVKHSATALNILEGLQVSSELMICTCNWGLYMVNWSKKS